MLGRLSRIIKRRRDPARALEDAENRLRAQQELRQTEQRKTEDQRGLEASSQMPPLGPP
jgi:hypothetical protein